MKTFLMLSFGAASLGRSEEPAMEMKEMTEMKVCLRLARR